MKPYRSMAMAAMGLIVAGCEKTETIVEAGEMPSAAVSRFSSNDALVEAIATNLADTDVIVTVDHSRLAEAEGVSMPPSSVTIYSDPAVNTLLMKLNPRVGLDLPCKVLVYEESGKQTVAYPSSGFLAKRHGIIDEGALAGYESAMKVALLGVNEEMLAPVGNVGVSKDYGIEEITSDFPLKESVTRLKEAVMKQGDTVWFGEVDFQTEAAAEGEKISGATLLLFGGPKPGGVAMAEFPKLGLDAFCQKLLVYEDEAGGVKIILNDIVAMAKLHYGKSAPPHEVINGRLMQTFENAVKKEDE